ncbi:MAG: hypothetical protein AAF551_00660, partial [Bacteroidota bacterium]
MTARSAKERDPIDLKKLPKVRGDLTALKAEELARDMWERVWPLPPYQAELGSGVGSAPSVSQAGSIAAGGSASGRARRWTAEEAARFGELMTKSRKNVVTVARSLGAGRTVGDVLAFYYGRWKQTEAYRALKAQMRLEAQRARWGGASDDGDGGSISLGTRGRAKRRASEAAAAGTGGAAPVKGSSSDRASGRAWEIFTLRTRDDDDDDDDSNDAAASKKKKKRTLLLEEDDADVHDTSSALLLLCG